MAHTHIQQRDDVFQLVIARERLERHSQLKVQDPQDL